MYGQQGNGNEDMGLFNRKKDAGLEKEQDNRTYFEKEQMENVVGGRDGNHSSPRRLLDNNSPDWLEPDSDDEGNWA